MSNLVIVSWCANDKCDPCKTGNLEIYGNNRASPFPPDDKLAICYMRGAITSFPEFPGTINATISLKGIYRPFVGNILSSGGGSVDIRGTGNSITIPCPLPSTFLQAPHGWPSSNDMLLFEVKAVSETTSAATLEINSITALFHSGSTITDVSEDIKWTGNVE
jgi:hypothetical protein